MEWKNSLFVNTSDSIENSWLYSWRLPQCTAFVTAHNSRIHTTLHQHPRHTPTFRQNLINLRFRTQIPKQTLVLEKNCKIFSDADRRLWPQLQVHVTGWTLARTFAKTSSLNSHLVALKLGLAGPNNHLVALRPSLADATSATTTKRNNRYMASTHRHGLRHQ